MFLPAKAGVLGDFSRSIKVNPDVVYRPNEPLGCLSSFDGAPNLFPEAGF